MNEDGWIKFLDRKRKNTQLKMNAPGDIYRRTCFRSVFGWDKGVSFLDIGIFYSFVLFFD